MLRSPRPAQQEAACRTDARKRSRPLLQGRPPGCENRSRGKVSPDSGCCSVERLAWHGPPRRAYSGNEAINGLGGNVFTYVSLVKVGESVTVTAVAELK